MQFKRSVIVVIVLVLSVSIGAAFTKPSPPETPKNLKVLPKDMSPESLDKIMDGYKAALGVKCNFCHVPSKEDPKHLDFASDEKGEKKIARSMMRMTLKINKKFFDVNNPIIGDTSLVISCNTCHHGEPHPENKPMLEDNNH